MGGGILLTPESYIRLGLPITSSLMEVLHHTPPPNKISTGSQMLLDPFIWEISKHLTNKYPYLCHSEEEQDLGGADRVT